MKKIGRVLWVIAILIALILWVIMGIIIVPLALLLGNTCKSIAHNLTESLKNYKAPRGRVGLKLSIIMVTVSIMLGIAKFIIDPYTSVLEALTKALKN